MSHVRIMWVFSDESGLLLPGKRQTPYFGLGGLAVPDLAEKGARDGILALRMKHSFYSSFEYKSNNRKKVPFCRELVDWYFEQADIGFFALVLRVADIDWSYWKKGYEKPFNACYTYFYRLMLSKFLSDYIDPGVFVKVVIDTQSIGQKELRNRFTYFQGHDAVMACEERKTREDDLLQLTDFLLGSTVNRFTVFEHPNHTSNPVKNGLSEYLLKRLGIPCFWNWRRVGEHWGLPDIRWSRHNNWERPAVAGTKRWGRKFDLFSWHGNKKTPPSAQ